MLKSFQLEELIQQCQQGSIDKIITIAVEPNNLKTVRELAGRFECVYCTQGVHPHQARLFHDGVKDELEQAGRHEKVVAIGEIGLDYHYDHSPPDIQRGVFETQLEVAIKLKKPVVIHTREAEEDTMAILKNFSGQIRGVLHSFSSKKTLAEFALKEGFYLGFNGITTFKRAEEVREIVAITPPQQILIETDAPFLTPVPHRGKENSPLYLPLIAQQINQIKGSNLCQMFYDNAMELFHFQG